MPVLSSPCSSSHFPRQQSCYPWLGGTCCVASNCSLASDARLRAQPTLLITFTVSVLLILIRNTARRSHQPLRFAETRIRRQGSHQTLWRRQAQPTRAATLRRYTRVTSTESLFPDTASAVRADKETVISLANSTAALPHLSQQSGAEVAAEFVLPSNNSCQPI